MSYRPSRYQCFFHGTALSCAFTENTVRNWFAFTLRNTSTDDVFKDLKKKLGQAGHTHT